MLQWYVWWPWLVSTLLMVGMSGVVMVTKARLWEKNPADSSQTTEPRVVDRGKWLLNFNLHLFEREGFFRKAPRGWLWR